MPLGRHLKEHVCSKGLPGAHALDVGDEVVSHAGLAALVGVLGVGGFGYVEGPSGGGNEEEKTCEEQAKAKVCGHGRVSSSRSMGAEGRDGREEAGMAMKAPVFLPKTSVSSISSRPYRTRTS